MAQDNVLDNLFRSSINEDSEDVQLLSEEIVLPKRCVMCRTAVICSMLPTFINLSKINVYLTIDQCPYSQPIKNVERKTNK